MTLPIGIFANVGAVAIGALCGGLLKKVLSKKLADALFIVTAFCAMSIGIISVIKLSSLTIVMISVILGCVIGELCHINDGISWVNKKIVGLFSRKSEGETMDEESEKKRLELLGLSVAIICFSGTGFFGALSEGLDGDHSILLAKSVLDFFTVLVIAASIGLIVAVFAIPQAIIYAICFFIAALIAPVLTPEAIGNFKSVGGVLTLVIGYNMLASQTGLKKVRVLNLTPAFVLVLLFTYLMQLTGISI